MIENSVICEFFFRFFPLNGFNSRYSSLDKLYCDVLRINYTFMLVCVSGKLLQIVYLKKNL